VTTGEGASRRSAVDVHERIIQAASGLTDGHSRLTMEHVADAAGVARQTVYRHVGSKDELLATVFARRLAMHQQPGPLGRPDVVRMVLTELTLARALTQPPSRSNATMAAGVAEAFFASPAIAACRGELWHSILRRCRDSGAMRADLDAESAIRWLTYNEVWLLAHPTVICVRGEDLRRHVDDYVVGALR
jgi:AcrR family transcriptional regulator